MRRHVFLVAVPMVMAATIATAGSPDLEAERAALFRLDKAWAQAAAARDVEKTVSFWADDARVVPPGQPAVIGKEALRQYVAGGFALPGFSIQWDTSELSTISGFRAAVNETTSDCSVDTGSRGHPVPTAHAARYRWSASSWR